MAGLTSSLLSLLPSVGEGPAVDLVRVLNHATDYEVEASSLNLDSLSESASKSVPTKLAPTLDYRVGEVVRAQVHPLDRNLNVFQVTCGADEDLQIVQGWRKENKPNYSALINKPVIVLCNEEITTVKGKESSGRIVVAYNSQEVEVVTPPRDTGPGDEVWLTHNWRHPTEVVDAYTVKQASWRFTVNQDYAVMNGNSFWTVGGRKVETNRLHSVAVK